MHLLPLLRRGRSVDRRPHERMPKPYSRAELDQARISRRRRRLGANPELRGNSPHQCLIADRLGRGDQQQAPGLDWENVEPPAEALFDATGQSLRTMKTKSTGQLLRGQSPRQFQQCQRVAVSLSKDLIADLGVQWSSQHGIKKRSRVR